MLHLVTVTPKGCFEMNCISNHADPAELDSLLCQLATHSQNSWTWGVLERDILVSRTLCPQSHHPSAKYHKEASMLHWLCLHNPRCKTKLPICIIHDGYLHTLRTHPCTRF